MAKKLNFVNDVQGNDVTANEAVKKNGPTWANREKTGGRSHDERRARFARRRGRTVLTA